MTVTVTRGHTDSGLDTKNESDSERKTGCGSGGVARAEGSATPTSTTSSGPARDSDTEYSAANSDTEYAAVEIAWGRASQYSVLLLAVSHSFKGLPGARGAAAEQRSQGPGTQVLLLVPELLIMSLAFLRLPLTLRLGQVEPSRPSRSSNDSETLAQLPG